MLRKIVLIILGITLYLSLRLPNISTRMTYHLDQGLHILDTYKMVTDKKIRLIGPMAITQNFQERYFFIGPQYYYILAILGTIFAWNPLAITIFLIFFDLIVLLIFCHWLFQKYSMKLAILFFLLFTLGPYFIAHARFFWQPHFILPLDFLSISTLLMGNYFIFGILWGLAFSFHYTAILWGLNLIIFLFLFKKIINIKQIFLILIGFLIGDLPYFIFELRNNFYNIRTIILIFTHGSTTTRFAPHYLVYPLIPLFIFIIIRFYKKILPVSLAISFLILVQYLFTDRSLPYGHPPNWNYVDELKVVNLITKDSCPKDFNIASTLDSDTRALDIRSLLTVKKCPPMSVTDYPVSKTLFLVSPATRDPLSDTVWEISVFRPFKIVRQVRINDKLNFYELKRIEK